MPGNRCLLDYRVLGTMADPIITLTSDFGAESPYVAAMKGVILAINPSARIVDLSHHIPPQDLRYTAFFLAASVPFFRPEVLHVIVVDPAVGTERALLYVEVNAHRLLVPDNGCWTALAGKTLPRVIRLTEPRYWRESISGTFHGRDILSPVAGHLSLGLDARLLGPIMMDWTRIDLPAPVRETHRIRGEVLFIDHFGNLITNISADLLPSPTVPLLVKVGAVAVSRRVQSYGEVEPDAIVALVSSAGLLEIAVNQGNAAQQLRATVGTLVVVTPSAQGE